MTKPNDNVLKFTKDNPRESKKKSVEESVEYLNSPCSIAETVQIARGVAEDTFQDMYRRTNTLLVSALLQIETMKDILIENGITTKEQLNEVYARQVNVYEETKKQRMESSPKMDMTAGSIDVRKE